MDARIFTAQATGGKGREKAQVSEKEVIANKLTEREETQIQKEA
jgi:hypothetical protein